MRDDLTNVWQTDNITMIPTPDTQAHSHKYTLRTPVDNHTHNTHGARLPGSFVAERPFRTQIATSMCEYGKCVWWDERCSRDRIDGPCQSVRLMMGSTGMTESLCAHWDGVNIARISLCNMQIDRVAALHSVLSLFASAIELMHFGWKYITGWLR